MERLAAEGTLVVFNRLLEVELWETLFKLALRERHPSKDLKRVRYVQVRRRAPHQLSQLRVNFFACESCSVVAGKARARRGPLTPYP